MERINASAVVKKLARDFHLLNSEDILETIVQAEVVKSHASTFPIGTENAAIIEQRLPLFYEEQTKRNAEFRDRIEELENEYTKLLEKIEAPK